MKTTERWTYGAVAVTGGKDNGIATVEVSGLVSPADMARLLIENKVWLLNGASAQIASYQRACLLMDPQTLCDVAQRAIAERGVLIVPTAIIVPPDLLEWWQTYARLMSERGTARAAFADPVQARQWAQRWAAIYDAARQDRT